MSTARGAWLLGLFLCARSAHADEPRANCDVRIVQARKDGQGIDPKITVLRPYLEREPFNDWKHFQLLDDKRLTLAPHATDQITLPSGKLVSLTYVDHMLKPDGKHRLRLRLEISRGEKKMVNLVYVLDEGGMLVQAAQRHATNELLILGISCDIPND